MFRSVRKKIEIKKNTLLDRSSYQTSGLNTSISRFIEDRLSLPKNSVKLQILANLKNDTVEIHLLNRTIAAELRTHKRLLVECLNRKGFECRDVILR